ncbi:DUF3084 domain-containing protein [Aminivibrio sp.]|uniref:DUF3084 domain-containing protein n=1 Tax=Aminivibrio sp. TaxID=1872489 RepID=UPI001A3A41E5|nr:DUF3084 domain-containing protein [Aminivibrio sp.]MBL3539473.1 DUF3084 domain-containing protein [Aminivibrio sp.]MDK2959482.1 hypothetical protein [Synergistaceae bacterium]
MQLQLWSDMNWRLILTLIVLSGVLAYLGDVLGMRIGKKRISLFGLRPRDTSRLITAVTGMFISIAVLITMTVISENVRTALFSMKFIRGQLQSLTRELQESRSESQLMAINLLDSEKRLKEQEEKLLSVQNELATAQPLLEEIRQSLSTTQKERDQLEEEKKVLSASVEELRREAEELRKGLIQIRSGRIAVFAKEILGQMAVEPMSDRSEVEQIFQDLRRRAEYVIAARTGLSPSEIVLAVDIEKEMEKIASCTEQQTRKFVRTVAEANAVFGEDIKITYEVSDSELVYRKGDVLYVRTVDPGAVRENAEAELHLILRMVNRKAVQDSIKPDPVTGKVGALDATAFFEAVETIRKAESKLTVEVTAAEDIYTEGPVRVTLNLRPAEEQ